MCGLTVNVAVRVLEETAVGVAAGLMQGRQGSLQSGCKSSICGYSASAFGNSVSMLIAILSGYRAIIAMIHNSRVADLGLW